MMASAASSASQSASNATNVSGAVEVGVGLVRVLALAHGVEIEVLDDRRVIEAAEVDDDLVTFFANRHIPLSLKAGEAINTMISIVGNCTCDCSTSNHRDCIISTVNCWTRAFRLC